MSATLPSIGELLAIAGRLVRLRSGPHELTHSPKLLIALIVSSVILDLGIGSAIEYSGPLLARSLLSMVLLLALSWTALSLRGMLHRYVQTASALVLCAMVFSVIALPLALAFGTPPAADQPLNGAQMLIALIGLAVVIWKIWVDAHIVRQAIDAPMSLGVMLALSWAIADWALGQAIFPSAT